MTLLLLAVLAVLSIGVDASASTRRRLAVAFVLITLLYTSWRRHLL
jgi:hypothetical protein